ncbi:amidohydrolase family protein [Candidatus Peregrinibacteria bacterium]|nr:amidohydrolase family protein [Candidatus Peregrinibacteria bacterium]
MQITSKILLVFFLSAAIVFPMPAQAGPAYRIIDTHEHIGSFDRADELSGAMENLGIEKTILLPSPVETLTANGKKSFTGYRKNVDEILKITKAYPEKFIPLCTVNATEPNALLYLKHCVKRGGRGLKLYNGHSYFYSVLKTPLDGTPLLALYAYAEKIHLPLLFHINIQKYQKEFENALAKYPDLVVSVPHFMVSSLSLPRVERLLAKYPNLYTDISFGSPEFMAAGLRRISGRPQDYADFFRRYPDRILFGTDMVITETESKDQAFMEAVIRCYRDMLEKETYACAPVNDYYREKMENAQKEYETCKPKTGSFCAAKKTKWAVAVKSYEGTRQMNGLGLDPSLLEKIYWENPNRFLTGNL